MLHVFVRDWVSLTSFARRRHHHIACISAMGGMAPGCVRGALCKSSTTLATLTCWNPSANGISAINRTNFLGFPSLYDKTLPHVWSQSLKKITKSEGITIIITSSRSTIKKKKTTTDDISPRGPGPTLGRMKPGLLFGGCDGCDTHLGSPWLTLVPHDASRL